MKLPRKTPRTTSFRQRLRSADLSDKPASFAYYARRSDQDLNTGRQVQREQQRSFRLPTSHFWAQRFGLIILLVAVVVSVISAVSLSTDAKILPLDSANSNLFLHDQSDYQAAADRLLAASIWSRNKLTINTSKLEQQLTAQFPELASSHITLPLLAHRPLVYIDTAQPALLLTTADGTYLLDSTGKALLTGAQLNRLSNRKLPMVNDQSGLRVQLNHQVITSQNVGFIETVVAQLTAKHAPIATMTLPATASELDVQIAGQPYFVKFNLASNDARQQAGTYLATAAQLQKQGTIPAQYIDVRVDGRAYYR